MHEQIEGSGLGADMADGTDSSEITEEDTRTPTEIQEEERRQKRQQRVEQKKLDQARIGSSE